MAAVIKCDCCGKIVTYNKAKHLRIHELADTTSYMVKAEEWFDICDECCSKIKNMIKTGGTDNAN